jgi:6,7-dimethyl-8-ribityllumazine synthase
MQGADRGDSATPADGRWLNVAVVRARFNDVITRRLTDDCITELKALGVKPEHIRTVDVPGALEIPLALEVLARSDEHDALVAVGCVIRGETYHFEIVSNRSSEGVQQVALEHGIAIANGILTVDTEAQALARAATHGATMARVAVEMANLVDELT